MEAGERERLLQPSYFLPSSSFFFSPANPKMGTRSKIVLPVVISVCTKAGKKSLHLIRALNFCLKNFFSAILQHEESRRR